jgi:DNA-binding response OmpR family regulator
MTPSNLKTSDSNGSRRQTLDMMDTIALTLVEIEQRRTRASIRIGSWRVDPQSGAAQNPTGEQRLRRKELELLMFLHENAGAIISRDELLRHVWNYQGEVFTRTVDQTVATLRRKLNDNSAKPKYLLTVYGVGYRLCTKIGDAN